MIYIGIDPGKSGAMAVVEVNDTAGENDRGRVVCIKPFDEKQYCDTLLELISSSARGIRCCVERVSAMPGQGVTSMFNFGKNFGYILGLLDVCAVPYELVTPRKWKGEFGVTSDKNSSIAVCKRLFPNVSLLPTERCRKDNDGMAEALLMAEYARRWL